MIRGTQLELTLGGMQEAYRLAMEGLSDAFESERCRQELLLYAEYEKLMCDSTSGVDRSAHAT